MAVLRLPAALVADSDAVAAIAPLQLRRAVPALQDVGHLVTQPQHHAGSGGEDVDPFALPRDRWQPEIGALVRVVAQRTAGEIGGLGAGIGIDIVLDHAVLAGSAVDRQGEAEGRLLREDRGRSQGKGEGETGHVALL